MWICLEYSEGAEAETCYAEFLGTSAMSGSSVHFIFDMSNVCWRCEWSIPPSMVHKLVLLHLSVPQVTQLVCGLARHDVPGPFPRAVVCEVTLH